MPEFFDWKEIIKKIEEWITGHTDDDKDPNLVPVLLIPGIGASILNAVRDKGHKERVWVRLFAADREFKKRVWSRYDPATGKTVSLDPDSHIEVPDDNYGLYSCDILDPAVIIRLNVVYNFHDLIEQMLKWGYSEGTTLFGYGYDFRQSNRLPEAVDGLRVRLETVHKRSGGKKVNIISHSMGGLLVKSFLALQPNAFETLVNSWTTISTPFQGAPGYITDCLLTGVEFLKGWQKELWVCKWSTHQLLVECPSVYEMMASLTHEWQRTPQLRIWKKKKVNGNSACHAELHSYGPLASVSVIEAALKDNTLSYEGKTIPIPFNRCILEWANESRRLWLSAKLPEGFKFYNIYGTTNETAFDVCYGSEEKPIKELKEILHTEAEFVCVDGDGTVPSESSMADGLTATARYGVPGSHRGLLRSKRLFELLKDILEIKKDQVSLKSLPEEPEQVIHKVEHICLHMNHQNWDTVSEDSQDYNLLSEKDETVAAIQMQNARAEAHATASIHDPHPGFNEEHVKVSITGVSEGTDKELMNRVLEQAMASALDKFKACNLYDS